MEHKLDWAYGTGAALDVSLGFVPGVVFVTNITDGDVINIGYPSSKTMAFSSGGTNELKAGHIIVGATSGATARVVKVLADTGTWAGGDAAGTLIIDANSVTGTFTSENIYYQGSTSTNDATGAALSTPGQDIDTEVASDTGISAYLGSATAAPGITIGSGISEDAKLLAIVALRTS
ncbi:MAG: hypothetical protein HQL56_06885 [Magnetococcales bacterium]|nr:hypothetical protein [Magnetococcales bacterium]